MFLKDRALESFYACRGGIEIFHRKILVSGYRETSWGKPFVFQKNSGLGKKMGKRGVSQFSDNFLSHVPKNIVGEKFCVSEKVWYEKKLVTGGGCHVCPSDFFLSHSAEGLRGEAFCTAENLSFEKTYSICW